MRGAEESILLDGPELTPPSDKSEVGMRDIPTMVPGTKDQKDEDGAVAAAAAAISPAAADGYGERAARRPRSPRRPSERLLEKIRADQQRERGCRSPGDDGDEAKQEVDTAAAAAAATDFTSKNEMDSPNGSDKLLYENIDDAKKKKRPEVFHIDSREEPTPPTSSQTSNLDGKTVPGGIAENTNESQGADIASTGTSRTADADPILPPDVLVRPLVRPGVVAVVGPGLSGEETGRAATDMILAEEEEQPPNVQAYAVSDEAFQSEAHEIVRRMMDSAVVVEAEEVEQQSRKDKAGSRWCTARGRLVATLVFLVVAIIIIVLGTTGTFGREEPPPPQEEQPLQELPSCDENNNCWVPRGPALSRPAADLEEVWDEFGEKVSLSDDGSRLAVSARRCDVTLVGNSSGVRCASERSSGSEEEAGAVWVYNVRSNGTLEGPIGEFFGIKGDKSLGLLSGDGKRISIMARFREGANETKSAGEVRFYELTGPGNKWAQLGSPIRGQAAYDRTGKETAMSHDGQVVAVTSPSTPNGGGNGTVRVYRYNADASAWEQFGSDLVGEAMNDQYGWAVSMNKDGTVVAVGARFNNSTGVMDEMGYFRVFHLVSGNWVQLGEDVEEKFGMIVLSDDGMTLAAGAWEIDSKNGEDGGRIRVFEYNNEEHVWDQVGNSIYGDGANDRLRQVSISAGGKRIATGAEGRITSGAAGNNTGYVRVYDNAEGAWQQVGGTLSSNWAGDNFGRSVEISGDGTRLVIGAPSTNSIEIRRGYVRVYDLRVQ